MENIDYSDGMEKLKETFSKLNNIQDEIYTPQLQQALVEAKKVAAQWEHIANSNAMQRFFEETKRATEQWNQIYKSDTVQQMLKISNQIADAFSTFHLPQISEETKKALVRVKYIGLLKRIKWPLFLINDEEFENDVMQACSDEGDTTMVLDVVARYCNEQYLQQITSKWANSTAICADRKPVLIEAVLMHNKGYYYASTSILMCQIYGIAADIVGLAEKNGLVADEEDKELVSQHYSIDLRYIDREKGRLMQTILFTDHGIILWDAMVSYLKDEVLCSSDSAERWRYQPLRNKICHGEQLNYGTTEHSLKAILSIDILIRLANEIERISGNRNGGENNE